MTHKVLLADDSLTIQKVIKITLANQPYEIVDCASDDELFQKLPNVLPKIVFLDFNLSEKFSGYELASKIKSISPSTKILFLLGTFDTLDDAAMEKCGASDKVVKPFDSNKFILICKQLISEDEDSEEINFPALNKEQSTLVKEELPEEQWQMKQPISLAPSLEVPKVDSLPATHYALNKELSDWGMSVPNVINSSEELKTPSDLPPVIESAKIAFDSVSKVEPHNAPVLKSDAKFPSSDDLDYPDMSSEPVSFNTNLVSKTESPDRSEKKSSKLVSLETFNEGLFELEMEPLYAVEETNVSSIEDQIRDEVEKDLWKVDEIVDTKDAFSRKNDEDARNEFRPTMNDFDETLFRPLDEKESIDWKDSPESLLKKDDKQSNVSIEDFRADLEIMVKRCVKEYMDEMFRQNVEKISWEVIPDLAENLIRQELGKISNKIIND